MLWVVRAGSRMGGIVAVVVVVGGVVGTGWWDCGVWWACCAPLFMFTDVRLRPSATEVNVC